MNKILNLNESIFIIGLVYFIYNFHSWLILTAEKEEEEFKSQYICDCFRINSLLGAWEMKNKRKSKKAFFNIYSNKCSLYVIQKKKGEKETEFKFFKSIMNKKRLKLNFFFKS